LTFNLETIRKMMGWCPNVTQSRYRLREHVDFENIPQISSGRTNVEKCKSDNILFSANSAIFTFCLIMSLNIVLMLGRSLEYAVLIPILVLMYSLLYFLQVKMLQAGISIDENGINLKSFELRNILLNYNDIKSVQTFKFKKPSNLLIAIMFLILAAFLVFSVITGEWKVIVSIAPMLPWYLLIKQHEKPDLDTQLYIESSKKKWYRFSPYYSVITDQVTAAGIEDAIEKYRGEE